MSTVPELIEDIHLAAKIIDKLLEYAEANGLPEDSEIYELIIELRHSRGN